MVVASPPRAAMTDAESDAAVQELLRRPYRRVVTGDPAVGYLAEVPELPGCFTAGDTPEEAMALLRDAMGGWFDVRLRDGLVIPEPDPAAESHSGKFLVRVPKRLHAELARQAEREGVSLNALATTYLAREAGYQAARAE